MVVLVLAGCAREIPHAGEMPYRDKYQAHVLAELDLFSRALAFSQLGPSMPVKQPAFEPQAAVFAGYFRNLALALEEVKAGAGRDFVVEACGRIQYADRAVALSGGGGDWELVRNMNKASVADLKCASSAP
jgi:hypothetical protein